MDGFRTFLLSHRTEGIDSSVFRDSRVEICRTIFLVSHSFKLYDIIRFQKDTVFRALSEHSHFVRVLSHFTGHEQYNSFTNLKITSREESKMTNLRHYFPMLKTRRQVRDDIETNAKLKKRFLALNEKDQERFLDICCGNRGVRILYDVYFKEILNPDSYPERLTALLSVLLDKKITSIRMLRGVSSLILDNTSLMILDIVVELDDGSIADVEIQKIGYAFPGQRAGCYSADLLMRQYGRGKKREKKDKKFTYDQMKPVYSIIFIESSGAEFHAYPKEYIHVFRQKSNTGLEIDLLQNYIFIPLDIFQENINNGNISRENLSHLDAWLLFLSSDKPDDIILLIEQYPEFRPMYEDLFSICQNEERMMDMYEDELRIMDHNTVLLMIDTMKDQIDKQSKEIMQKDKALSEKDQALSEKDQALSRQNMAIKNLQSDNQTLLSEIESLKKQLAER